MNLRQVAILVSVFIVALVLGVLGEYAYSTFTNTTYQVELSNGCTKQPNGQVVNTVVAGSTLEIRVLNNKASEFSSFALSHGICLVKL